MLVALIGLIIKPSPWSDEGRTVRWIALRFSFDLYLSGRNHCTRAAIPAVIQPQIR